MRPARLPLALAAVLLAACATPCEELGNRICECSSAGTQRNQCEDSVSRQLDDADPDDELCERKLDSCSEGNVPAGSQFCEWIRTDAGKVACGYAY